MASLLCSLFRSTLNCTTDELEFQEVHLGSVGGCGEGGRVASGKYRAKVFRGCHFILGGRNVGLNPSIHCVERGEG